MLPQWNVKTNYFLGTFNERSTVSIPLPLASTNGVTSSVISGALPRGLRIENNSILGTPVEVIRATQSTFVIRARTSEGSLDRTFKILVEGADNPVWVTPEGRLPVGPNNVLFILDSSYIDFQLIATDNDLSAGDNLEYYIENGDGELPPGISLTSAGKLIGVIEPIVALEVNIVNSGYDSDNYGTLPFDFSVPSGSGIDTFYYDTTGYDYSVPTRVPRKLNRYYEFYVTVSDSVSKSKRRFQIFVVGDDFVRADNTILKAADGVFTADATYLRAPLWLTPGDLGVKRANNYVTLYLDTIDQNYVAGKIIYLLESINIDNTPSVLPPGLTIDQITGEIAGRVPYQPAVTKEYKFTVNAIRFNADNSFVTVFATVNKDLLSGSQTIRIAKLDTSLVDGIDDLSALVGIVVPINNRYYTIVSVDDNNDEYDELTLDVPLEPIINISPLSLIKGSTAGSDHFFVTSLTTNEQNFYLNKIISFSSVANHKIVNVYPYIEYNISLDDSSDGLELNTGIIGDSGSNIVSVLTDFFTDGDLNAYVSAISGINGIKQLTLIIPNTAQNRNSNYIKNLFHTADSSLILVNVVSTFDRIKLDTTLINSLFVNRQISFGVVTGNFFKKTFPLAELDVVEKKKTFTIKIQGEVDSTITWLVDSNLGKLNANRISTLFVRAETTVPDTVLKYTKIAGNLPPGLVLKDNGEIIGKTPIFGNVANPGLTFFNSGNTIFDGRTTTFDRTYTFTVQAKDRFGFSAITREFSITIDDTDDLLYSNIFIKPYLKNAQRLAFDFFITSSSLIPPALVYRPSDPNFGVQLELRSLVYAGIQTRDIAAFVAATVKNHKPKRYFFGNINTAVAKQEGTNDILYEVVYIELVDRSKPITGKAKSVFNTINSKKITVDSVAYETLNDQFPNTATEVVRNRPAQQTITIDNTAIQASQSTDSRKYISNIDNMRKNIKATGASSRDFLPLWMRTPQGSSLADLDYVFAIPLVYTIPGESETIRQNIENSGFDFNQIDYYIDRYIIDATTGNSQEQYILFAKYTYNV